MSAAKRWLGTWLKVLWTLAVIAAFVVVLPLLALWSIFSLPALVIEGRTGGSISALVGVLWPVAGAVGVVGLLAARPNRQTTLRSIRIRQAMLLAGIVAAMPPIVGAVLAIFDASVRSGFWGPMAAFAVPFAVLSVQAVADIRRLQHGVVRFKAHVGTVGAAGAADPIPACFLALAILCATAALIGQLLLDIAAR